MNILILTLGAVLSYLVGALNPAIVLSNLIYHEDIRKRGSGNPGFTNFMRSYGVKWAMVVMILDLAKAAVCVSLVSWIYATVCEGSYQFAAAFCGLFAMAGHAFPVWYGFKGGKGFLVYMSIIFLVDWRAGLIGTAVLAALLFTTRYMSLSSMCAVFSTVLFLIIARAADPVVIILCALQVIFVFIRHKENIARLFKGTESKFKIKKS